MKKNTNLCVDLKTIMQEDVILNEGQGYHGVLTRDGKDHYLFDEASRLSRTNQRNPKLFDGNYCSLVHMQNGKYKIHMRTFNASTIGNGKAYAQKCYKELLKALAIIG
jgi:hypothetical protein